MDTAYEILEEEAAIKFEKIKKFWSAQIEAYKFPLSTV